jgi:hypothetical protein
VRARDHDQSRRPVAIAVALAGFAGYFYVFGGAQLFMNFTAGGLPAGTAMDFFAARRFVTVGVAVAVAVMAITAGAAAAGTLTYVLITHNRPRRDYARWIAPRVAIVVFVAATIFVTFVFPFFRPFRLPVATVVAKDGACVVGPFIGEDADGAQLIDGKTGYITSIPAADLKSVTLREALPVTHVRVREGRAVDTATLLTRCNTYK